MLGVFKFERQVCALEYVEFLGARRIGSWPHGAKIPRLQPLYRESLNAESPRRGEAKIDYCLGKPALELRDSIDTR